MDAVGCVLVHLILGDESPTTNFPDIPGYVVCDTTRAVMYLQFGSPHSIV